MMCARINIRTNLYLLFAKYRLNRSGDINVTPRYNVAPMTPMITIRQDADGSRHAAEMQWGLLSPWSEKPSDGAKCINVRAETIDTLKTFKGAFSKRRCVVVASGYYEWQKIGIKTKQPYHIYRADGDLISFAGLWSTWTPPGGNSIETCTIATTTPNHALTHIHDRMPVILSDAAVDDWLDPATDQAILKAWLEPCPDDWMKADPIGPAIGNVGNQRAELIIPVKSSRTLFD